MSVADIYRNRGVNPLAADALATVNRVVATIEASQDNFMSEGAKTTNLNTAGCMQIWPLSAQRQRALITVDFSASIPSGMHIVVAKLLLNCTQSDEPRAIVAYRLLRTDWNEATSTWNLYKTGSDWGTAGALNTTSDITTTDKAYAVSSIVGQFSIDVTAQVQTALDSVAGVAHFCIADEGMSADKYQVFSDTENATASLRPKLYIEATRAV
jgi:hypothetical protein